MFQLNGNYSLSKTTNDADGQGSTLFPMNSYDLSGEFGRSSFDIRHRFTIFGTVNLPWWKLVVNPFVVANSGPGFNIITGLDRNLDRQVNERPSFAGPNADCSDPMIRCTRFGNFNLNPKPGEQIIPRNYGQAPGNFYVNLRVSRTFTFGTINRGNAAAPSKPAGQTTAANAGGDKRPAGGPGGPTSAGGGAKVAAVGLGPQGGSGGSQAARPTEKRYTLNVSLNFQNILNRVNLATPVGNLSSPSFGESLGLAGTFGGLGGSAGGSGGAGNRRIYATVRLNF
jgi:hypothetical protein